jgi:alkane 1-monooxygenase
MPPDGTAVRPREAADPKRYLWLNSAMVTLLPFFGIGLARHTGHGIFWWTTPLFVFVWFPIFDLTSVRDSGNPPADIVGALERDRYYRWCTVVYLPLQYAGLALAGWEWTHAPMSGWDRAGLIFTAGSVAGIGINTAHELGHKRERLEIMLSRIGLAPACYGHFLTEHNRGHHVRVATAEDPASSRLGETFWQFWPRSVVGGFRSAWRLEATRLRLRDRDVFSWRNEVLRSWSLSVLLGALLAVSFGPGVLVFFLAQAVVGFTLLEVVNYLEHYGLARQRTPSGRYEPVDPTHSWNSNALLSNLSLFQLQRHSDHHANPRRPYQTLRSFDSSPELPFGYATMIPLALIPAVWRRLMDPRVLAHYDGDVTRANLHPPARDRLLRRYGDMPRAAVVDSPAPFPDQQATPAGPATSPSDPLRGAAPVGMQLVGFSWVIGYDWRLLPGQEALGAWNYLLAAAFFLLPPATMLTWRGYPE